MTQLKLDLKIDNPGRLFPDPLDTPNFLTCSYCGQSGSKLGKYPKPAGKGWNQVVNFHPYCLDDLNRWGSH